MSFKEYEINYSISDVNLKDLLNSLNGKNSIKNYLIKNKKLYSGKIENDTIDVTTFDAPPMTVKGKISNNKLSLRIEFDSLKQSQKGLFLVVFYCIEFVMLLAYLKNFGFSLWIIPAVIFGVLLPIGFFKIYWFFNGYEPDPDFFVETLEKKITHYNNTYN